MISVRRAMIRHQVFGIVNELWDSCHSSVRAELENEHDPRYANAAAVEAVVEAVEKRAEAMTAAAAPFRPIIDWERLYTEEVHEAFPWARPE